MKVLIYGHNGWIGNHVIKLLEKESIIYNKGNERCNNKLAIENEIKNINPTHIMCFIGKTYGLDSSGNKINSIDYLENKDKIYENIRDNLYGPSILGLLCYKYNIHLTYMGTGCIFEYDSDHKVGCIDNGFTENDEPNFYGSCYSIVKGFTDQIMNMLDKTVLNVRIRMPITDEYNNKNFINKLLSYEYICSVPNSMTVLPDLLPLMIDMAKNSLTGTINLCNPGVITHNEILQIYKEIIDPNFTWKNFSLQDQEKKLLAKRSNNYMDTTKLTKLYPKTPSIKESIKNILIKMKK